MQLSRALKEIAASKGIKQADVCRTTGLSDAHISQIFSGKIRDPKASVIYKIAHAMDVTVDELVELAENYGESDGR